MRKIIVPALLLTLTASAQQKPKEPIVAHWQHMKKAADPALQSIQVPEGFHIEVFARDLENARMILSLEDGTVLVSRPKMNDVVAPSRYRR